MANFQVGTSSFAFGSTHNVRTFALRATQNARIIVPGSTLNERTAQSTALGRHGTTGPASFERLQTPAKQNVSERLREVTSVPRRLSREALLKYDLAVFGPEIVRFANDAHAEGATHIERRRRIIAAVRLYDFCDARKFFQEDEAGKDFRIYFIASTYSSGHIDGVRCALSLYFKFISPRRNLITNNTMVSIQGLCAFLGHIRNRQRNASEQTRGLAAEGRLASIASSRLMVLSPFTSEIVNSPVVKALARPTFATATKKESSVSLAYACLLEDIALAGCPEKWASPRRTPPAESI
jgi:hypothetical protein